MAAWDRRVIGVAGKDARRGLCGPKAEEEDAVQRRRWPARPDASFRRQTTRGLSLPVVSLGQVLLADIAAVERDAPPTGWSGLGHRRGTGAGPQLGGTGDRV